jgi:putative membrane protein insertion efficiency factor
MSLNDWAIKTIEKYQKNKEIIGSGRCKHYPSCSNYAIGCYKKFNFVKASFFTVSRILRCNPLTRKVYDPVPLSSKEKKELKKIRQNILTFLPALTKHKIQYPLMELQDYITLIYESTFGPYHLKEKIKSIDDAKEYLKSNAQNYSFKIETLGNDYQRIYINNEFVTNEMAENLYKAINNSVMNDVKIQIFNEKLYIFKKMIKKKEIPLDYTTVFNFIEDYLTNGITYLGHSTKYIINYPHNYILTKREKK